jgi:glycerol-3-phosphate O-acyltransferase/dihydroxyacetone phosphate acyltransferase
MGQEASFLYRLVRRVARAAMSLFYSTIEVTGLNNLDPTRPTLYAPTHPNSIIDPLLVFVFEDRPLRFIARDGLFSIPIMGQLLRAIGAIPVKRRSDNEGQKADNEDSLRAAREVLKAGGVLVIFPEGKTHARLRVEPLKTGVARIALDAEKDGPIGLRIVPVGLNYLVRHAFRSDVHIGVGEAITIDASTRDRADEPETVRALTAQVEASLRDLTVHIEREDDERLIAQVAAIIAEVREKEGLDPEGQSPAERIALVQRVLDAYRWYEEREPKRTAELRKRIIDLVAERGALGLGGERPALQHRSDRKREGRIWREERPLLIFLGWPFAVYGIATHFLPYVVMRLLLFVSPPHFYRAALMKLLLGALFFAAFYGTTTTMVWLASGPIAACVYLVSLVPAGLFARRYLTEVRLHRFGPKWIWRVYRHRSRMKMLQAERVMITEELAEIRRLYLAETKPA